MTPERLECIRVSLKSPSDLYWGLLGLEYTKDLLKEVDELTDWKKRAGTICGVEVGRILAGLKILAEREAEGFKAPDEGLTHFWMMTDKLRDSE